MGSKKAILLFIACVGIFTKFSSAQFYSTGQDPAFTKWNQIKSEHFQIIFQKDFVDQAQQIANILEFYYDKAGSSLNHHPKKISVILHNQTIISNGYVAWAPKRMELFATPPQDISPDPWLEHLCIHELRHVVQLDKLNQGITKVLSIVFGQQATGLVAGQLPMWYYEGDAVCTETAYTKFGRGRLPFFNQGIKTHLLSDEERYSFDKMLFGSYKDYVPNHYELGYQLTSYARIKYGKNIWSDIENHVAKNSFTLLPTSFAFYRGLKRLTGLSQKELYQDALNYLDSNWTVESVTNDVVQPHLIQNYEIDEYEDYLNPIYLDKNNFIALKKGLSHIPQFVWINENTEKILYEPGVLVSNDFSLSNNILVWAEYKPDTRWSNREYNKIKLLNVKNGNEFTLIEKSRYFSPDISVSAEKIVVVEVDKENNTSLVILSSFDGKMIKKIESNLGCFIQRPRWSEDGNSIYVIELTHTGKQVSVYSLINETWETVFQIHNGDVQRILPVKNKVYFHSTQNGTDNIFVFDQDSQETYQLSQSKYGIAEFDLDANETDLLVNEYTSQGFRLAKIPVERASWNLVNEESAYYFEFAEGLKSQEEIKTGFLGTDQKEYDIKPFRKPFHIFNFHSWIPAFIDYNNMDLGNVFADPSEIYGNIYPGLMLLSQNKLSTTESILSYAYKNGNHFLSSSIVFKGQYPVVKLTAKYGEDQYIQATQDAWIPETNIGYSYDLEIYVPFNLTRGHYIMGWRPLVSIEYFDNLYYNYQNNYYIKGMEFVQSQLLFYSYKLKAERDIIPKLGAIFDLNLFNTPFDSELFGYMFNADGLFYLPGGNNNGIKIDIGFQNQKPEMYLFNSNFRFPRGIQKKRTEKMFKVYGDYVFPIAYPDWNLGSFLYLKRIRGDFFVDYAYNTYKAVNFERTAYVWPIDHNFSFGLELTADYHLLRMMFPLNTGFRFGYAPTENNMIFEVLFGVDLYNF